MQKTNKKKKIINEENKENFLKEIKHKMYIFIYMHTYIHTYICKFI